MDITILLIGYRCELQKGKAAAEVNIHFLARFNRSFIFSS
jgi:hypothetical protein